MSKQNFRINSVTSQHPKYPASNLLASQQGWQSSINCEYPQAITIQFYVPIRTKKLHLCFHQYKISTLIQAYVKLGANKNYRKIGYITPNDNSQSSFEEKQQKILYFQFECTHIRLIFYQNFKNNRNIFNQIAIEGLVVMGEVLNHREIQGISFVEDQSSDQEVTESIEMSHNTRTVQSVQEINESSESLSLFKDVYIKLQQQKLAAVQQQDFQRASHLKTVINNFKHIEQQINKLQKQKMQALKNEDYDKCHKIKHQISKKKEIVEFQKEELFKNADQFYSQNSYSSRIVQRQVSPINQTKRKENVSNDIINFKSPTGDKQVNFKSSNFYDQQVVPALLNKGTKSTENLPLQTNQKRRELPDINQSAIQEVISDKDHTSIKKDLNNLRELTDRQQLEGSVNDSVRLELQPLQNKLRMRFQTYFGFIPERIWEMCENKNWRGKQEALRFMKDKIIEVQTKQHFMGVIEIISRIIISKQATISLDVISLLNKLADIKIKFTLQHMPFFVEEILSELLNFLSDTNKQIKELSYTTYLKLPQISFLGLNIVVRELIKHRNKVNKTKNDPKLIITKLQLMNALVERYSQQQYPLKEIINWILSFFEDPNQKVRVEASELLVTLTYLVGNQKVLKIIQTNKPQMVETVLNMMNASLEQSKIHNQQSKLSLQNSKLQLQFYGGEIGKSIKQSNVVSSNKLRNQSSKPIFVLEPENQQSKMSIGSRNQTENVNVDLSYSKESIFEQQKLKNQDEDIKVYDDAENSGICEYCGQPFDDEKQHLLNNCKVLVFCDKCSGCIYIREFTNHLLQQCQYSHEFSQCKRCGRAYQLTEISEHVGRDMCKKKLGLNWERCQFCGVDIFGEDKFWIKHAEECNNLPPRNVFYDQNQEQSQQQSLTISK